MGLAGMPDKQTFKPPYRYEPSVHGPVTIYDALNVGWIARIKESLPHKEKLARAMVDGLNRAARAESLSDEQRAAIQRGDEPAKTVVELVDALRQNLAGAGADVGSIELLLGRITDGLPADDPDRQRLIEALQRLKGHIGKLTSKATLAIDAADRS